MARGRFSAILLGLILLMPFLPAQESIEIRRTVDWETTTLQLDMTASIQGETNQPTGRYKTEQYILRQTPVITGEAVLPIKVDSWNTIGDLVAREPILLRRFESLSSIMKKIFTTATPDRKKLTVRYELPLFPFVADLLIKHDRPFSSPLNPSYSPNGEFTGIVIYAREALPWHGTNDQAALLAPCLFPKLYDPRLNEIHSLELTIPEAASRWGNAGYTYSAGISDLSGRIGVYPLRTMARAVYGKNRTDLILSEDAVQKITSSPHNRELLRQGRVVIILPPSE